MMVVVGWTLRLLHARQAQGMVSRLDASKWRYRTIILGGASKTRNDGGGGVRFADERGKDAL